MMSVSGSPLSGRGMYKAWCPKKKEIIHKELSGQDKSGMMYFKDFEGLEKENSDRNISDLIHLKELLNDLCIQE
jgi:hypothetical protein